MDKKYIVGAAIIAAVFLTIAWAFQGDDLPAAKNNTPIYEQPAAQSPAAKSPSNGDAAF